MADIREKHVEGDEDGNKGQQIRNDDENFGKFVERYRQVFQLDANHAGEEIAIDLSGSGERVLFHTESRGEPYQADKSTMDEKEWKALTDWIEKQQGKGPWVIIQGTEENVDLTGEDEDLLLRDENEKSGDEKNNDEERKEKRDSDTDREEGGETDEESEAENLEKLTSKISKEKPTSDEALKVIMDFCTKSTNAMKQCQIALSGAQTAVSNVEKIQKSITKEFEKQKLVFSTQMREMEQRGVEMSKQVNEMRTNYNKMVDCSKENEKKIKDAKETRDETPISDKIKLEISKLVKREFEKLKIGEKSRDKENSDNFANKVKETLKLEIISKDSGLRRDYKLTQNTKFEHFYDYFTSELRTLELLYVVDPEIVPSQIIDADKSEKHKYKVRDILINHLDQNYHSKVIHIKDPVEILNKIREMKKCESNLTSTTLRKQLYNMQHYPNKENASDFCDKFEDVVRNYENLSGVVSLSESEKRDAFFNAIMTTVPEVQSVEFMTKNSTGKGLSYDQLKLFLMQAEANKNQSASSETRAVMKAHGRDVKESRCYECDDNGHIAINCRFKGTGLKKCYECGQITNHKASECPIKRIKQTKFERGRGMSHGFKRGHYYRGNKFGNRSERYDSYTENQGFKRKSYDERSGDAKRSKSNRGRGNYKNVRMNDNRRKEKDDGASNTSDAKHAKGK